jgi:hypothetical protein
MSSKGILIALIFMILVGGKILGQESDKYQEGTVTYISSQNVYVKFVTTVGITKGDTLFFQSKSGYEPGLVVRELSSISCVCTLLDAMSIKLTDKVYFRNRGIKEKEFQVIIPKPESKPLQVSSSADTAASPKPQINPQQRISGRISVSSSTGFSNASYLTERMRYTFNLNIANIAGSKVSTETYFTFSHRNGQWQDIRDNVFNGLKIYSLVAIYEPGSHSRIVIGRRINPKVSSMGAVDGLQYEYRKGSFSGGLIAGTRPDVNHYGFNSGLLQYGAYVSHENKSKNGMVQTSFAFMEQTNNGMTDRRFSYLQHTNSLIPNLTLFTSAEFDLYKKLDSLQNNNPRLTNLYVSLRYRFGRKLSLSASYTNRHNIIYYETYKDIIERLLVTETTQGYQAQVNFRPINKLSAGLTAGYRFRDNDPKATKNLYGYVSYSSIPWIKASATVSITMLESSYLKGNIYSLGLSRDFLKGKFYGNVNYRYADYKYHSPEFKLSQHMAEVGMNWRFARKTSFALNYEGTFEKSLNYGYLFAQISKSF